MEICAACHGKTLEGGEAPSLIDNVWLHGGDDASILRSIRDGYPTRNMPGWGQILSKADIRGLLSYLREKETDYARRRRLGLRTDAAYKPLPTGIIRSERESFRVETVAQELQIPYAFAVMPDGKILVTDKFAGSLRLIEPGKRDARVIQNIPRSHRSPDGNGSLLDVVAHPDYARNRWIYLSYGDECAQCPADPKSGERAALTAIVRGRLKNGRWTDQEIIWRAAQNVYVPPSDNYAGRMAFDGRGYLYFSIGLNDDIKAHAQDFTWPKGKIHRIFDDGRIPRDNPFTKQPDALQSIWSYGHRNPQGLAFDTHSGQLWASEHGPRGGDELNLIRAGRNYGWPLITHGVGYFGNPISTKSAAPGMEQPVVQWTPTLGISSIAFYEGQMFPEWRHNLFVTSLKQEELLRLAVQGERVVHRETILKDIGRLRDIDTGPDGALYLLVEIGNPLPRQTRIVRLIRKPQG